MSPGTLLYVLKLSRKIRLRSVLSCCGSWTRSAAVPGCDGLVKGSKSKLGAMDRSGDDWRLRMASNFVWLLAMDFLFWDWAEEAEMLRLLCLAVVEWKQSAGLV